MDNLKPCPFCGGAEIYAVIDYDLKEFRIYCGGIDDCLAEMRLSFTDANLGNGEIIDFEKVTKIIQEMIERWNNRTQNDFKEEKQ